MAYLGNTDWNVDMKSDLRNRKIGSQGTLSVEGIASSMTFSVNNQGTSHTACNVRGIIYRVSDGALMGYTDPVAVADNIAWTALTANFATPLTLAAGDYWLLIQGDSSSIGARVYYYASGGTGGYSTDVYSDLPSSTLTGEGAWTNESYSYNVYVTYAPTGTTVTDTFMSPYTDGWSACVDATYATARSGGGAFNGGPASPYLWVGQYWSGSNFELYQAGVAFDTSTIPDAATITAATLKVWLMYEAPYTTGNTVEARVHSWGPTTLYDRTADYSPGDTFNSETLVASIPSASLTPIDNFYDFTSQSAFLAAVNKTGWTELCLCSNLFAAGTDSGTTDQTVEFASSDEVAHAKRPLLTVSYTVPSTGDRSSLIAFGIC